MITWPNQYYGMMIDVPDAVTVLSGISSYVFGLVSSYHLALASVVKAFIIFRPLTYFTIFSPRVLVICLVSVWLFAVGVGLAVHFIKGRWIFSAAAVMAGRISKVTWFYVPFVVVNYGVPFLATIISYAKIFPIACRNRRTSLLNGRNISIMCT